MGEVVDRRSAGIHFDKLRVIGDEFLFFMGCGVIEIHVPFLLWMDGIFAFRFHSSLQSLKIILIILPASPFGVKLSYGNKIFFRTPIDKQGNLCIIQNMNSCSYIHLFKCYFNRGGAL